MDLQALKELGLSEGQIKVYASVLDLGAANLNSIHEKTGIERRNIYDILNKLIERGMVSYIVEKGKKVYQCTSPSNIAEEVKAKQAALKSLEGELPKIRSLFELSKPKIRAEIYRGNESLKALLNEALEHKATYWIGGNSGVENTSLKNWFRHWMERRVEKNIMMYDLVDYGTHLEGLTPNNVSKHKKNYYKHCALPKELVSPMVVLIFGDKVAQILWSEQSFAFVIESKEITDSFMIYFKYFWREP